MDSKAIVASFCLELSKKLNLRFQGPPLPVDLAIVNRAESSAENDLLAAKIAALGGEDALKELLAMYEKNK